MAGVEFSGRGEVLEEGVQIDRWRRVTRQVFFLGGGGKRVDWVRVTEVDKK